jgi:hypothetical protein
VVFSYTNLSPYSVQRPYLKVVLRSGFSTSPALAALVDSGADRCIFPTESAQYLKLDLSRAPVWKFCGTTGAMQEARLAKVSLAILGNDDANAFEIETTCAFCDTLQFSSSGLLGQDGFFSRFKTTFCQAENYFEIEAV